MPSALPIAGNYSTVPTSAAFELDLRRSDHRLLILLCRFVNPRTQECRISQDRLAEYLGVRRQYVSFTILRLERLGFLTRETRPSSSGFKHNVYVIRFPPLPKVNPEYATIMRLRAAAKRAGKSRGTIAPQEQPSPLASCATAASCSFNGDSSSEVVVEPVSHGDGSSAPHSARGAEHAAKHSKR